MAREASALSSGAPVLLSCCGAGQEACQTGHDEGNHEFPRIYTNEFRVAPLSNPAICFPKISVHCCPFVVSQLFRQPFVVVLEDLTVFEGQLACEVFIQGGAVAASEHLPSRRPPLGRFPVRAPGRKSCNSLSSGSASSDGAGSAGGAGGGTSTYFSAYSRMK